MPLVKATFSASMQSAMLSSFGTSGGKDLKKFCDAIADGVDMTIKQSATFTTQDTGTVPQIPGVVTANGTGTGVTVSSGTISSNIKTQVPTFNGKNLSSICSAIESAFITYMSTASLKSTHTTVFQGSGQLSGGIKVESSTLKTNIRAQGTAKGFTGEDWEKFAGAIASGISNGLKSATATLTITGSVIPPTLPVPPFLPNQMPGSGTGSSAPSGAIS